MSFDQINDDGAAEQPRLCANNCGFFGNAGTMNMCSKCFKSAITVSQQRSPETTTSGHHSSSGGQTASLSEIAASDHQLSSPRTSPEEDIPKPAAKASRCQSCDRKVGLASGFVCKCGSTFCGTHRYPEKHACQFDFKRAGRDAIAKANPVVKADKIVRF